MLFPTFTFLCFFLLLLIIFAIVQETSPRKLILLIFSYIFYMWWNPAFILLIIFSTIIDFLIGRHLHNEASPKKRKQLLFLSIFSNLGILAFFKYANFFQSNMLLILQFFGYQPGWTALNITLPVGISFYTFQTMSYTIDVYKGNIPASKSSLDFALFVSFFPQLVAGPIVRAKDFLPQLQRDVRLNFCTESFFLILRGLTKKVIFADNIAIFSDAIFLDPIGWNSSVIWLAAFCFYIQIYCDFSGYSDMAIGIAKMLGFDLPQNFDRPYFAKNPSEYWKKWHISLSSWLRDYLYISLGGNRGGKWLTYRNLMLTMVLGGMWHGPTWNYILWGFVHGIALIVFHFWNKSTSEYQRFKGGLYDLFSLVLMQYWVLLSYICFRLEKFPHMLYCLKKFIFFDFDFKFLNSGLGAMSIFSTLFLLGIFMLLHIYSQIFGDIHKKLSNMPLVFLFPICTLIGFILFCFWPTGEKPFIYFQF